MTRGPLWEKLEQSENTDPKGEPQSRGTVSILIGKDHLPCNQQHLERKLGRGQGESPPHASGNCILRGCILYLAHCFAQQGIPGGFCGILHSWENNADVFFWVKRMLSFRNISLSLWIVYKLIGLISLPPKFISFNSTIRKVYFSHFKEFPYGMKYILHFEKIYINTSESNCYILLYVAMDGTS